MKKDVFEEFKWRGLVYDYTEGLPELLAKEKVTAYIGFDPTSDSLQVGNLLTLIGLARLQQFGHTPIAVAGGGTGMVGDPSGKSHERQLFSQGEVEANVEAIQVQLARFLDFEVKSNPAQIRNNASWLMPLSMMGFLRDVGKHFTVNYMMAKDSVKSRLQGEEGISYTEFSYMLLQAYDFLYLFDHDQCKLQAGGSDQWGNITAGIELIRRAIRSGDGKSSLIVSPKCPRLIEAMECYHYPESANTPGELPQKDGLYDHPIDALRYFFVNHARGGDKIVMRSY